MTTHTPMPPKRPTPPKTYPVCSLQKVMETIDHSCGNVHIGERHGEGPNKVILLPEAARELEVMISYGRRSPMNAKEQKYAGYGHYLMDEGGHVITVVKHFIEIHTMNRNAVAASNLGPDGEYNPGLDFLAYYREEFLRNEERYNTDAYGCQVDPFLELCGPSEFVLEGHTHPGLTCFYSSTDRVSGTARAATVPVCIFVCDPVNREMLGSVGRDFAPAEILVYARGEEPGEALSEDGRLIPPTDEIVRLTSQCLRTEGYAGTVRLRTRMDGKGCLKIKLVIPKRGRRG